MKSQSISLLEWVKTFFISAKENRKTSSATKGKEAISFGSKKADTERLNLTEFQRRSHIGNFYAGPHCIFDPRLIK